MQMSEHNQPDLLCDYNECLRLAGFVGLGGCVCACGGGGAPNHTPLSLIKTKDKQVIAILQCCLNILKVK